MEKVVITGASGFLGGALAKKLLCDGATVYGIGTKREKLLKFSRFGNFVPVVASFEDYKKLPEIIEERGFDAFFHFAWAGGFTTAIKDYKLQLSNAAYSGDAVIAAKEMEAKRFIYANTYNQFEILNFLRTDRFSPRYTCIYATGKTAASLICRTLSYNIGMEYCAGLVPMPYGENNYSKQLVNVVLNCLINGVPPKLVEGNNLYDLVYIDDIVNAFIAIGNYGVDMREYYIGHRKLKTFKEWMITIRDLVAPNVELKFGEYKDNQQIDYSMIDLDQLYRDTGFECKEELEDHIVDTAKWVEKNITW